MRYMMAQKSDEVRSGHPCIICHGDGRCHICNGTGGTYNSYKMLKKKLYEEKTDKKKEAAPI